jgi:tripartite-type tricarboxylate transporter receptor subunit TctC
VFDAGYNATLPSAFYVIAPKGLPKDVQDKVVAASLKAVRSEEFLKPKRKQLLSRSAMGIS